MSSADAEPHYQTFEVCPFCGYKDRYVSKYLYKIIEWRKNGTCSKCGKRRKTGSTEITRLVGSE